MYNDKTFENYFINELNDRGENLKLTEPVIYTIGYYPMKLC